MPTSYSIKKQGLQVPTVLDVQITDRFDINFSFRRWLDFEMFAMIIEKLKQFKTTLTILMTTDNGITSP